MPPAAKFDPPYMTAHKFTTRLDFDIFVRELIKPVADEPEDAFFDNLFDSVPTSNCEHAMYEALVSIRFESPHR